MGLDEKQVPADPIELFNDWQALVKQDDPFHGTAMALATADADGAPSVRMVLLKHSDQDGFTFYTNYGSRKAADLDVNPRASLMFWWPVVNRQIRIEGTVARVSEAEADAYHESRPRLSQISTWASSQSEVIESRRVLSEAMDRLIREYGDGPVPRPAYWGGYCLKHDVVEFWMNRDNRLHDRVRYTRENKAWRIERLAP